MHKPPLYLGVDVGGSAVKVGLVAADGSVGRLVVVPTDPGDGTDAAADHVAAVALQAAAEAGVAPADLAAVGVACAGLLDVPAGTVTFAPNLWPWADVPVGRRVAEAFGRPTAFLNDGQAAALGEHWAGAGRGASDLVVYVLGTGIGGALILGDRLVTGAHGAASELGHVRIAVADPRPCPCGLVGCLEAYASGTAVAARAREAGLSAATARDVFAAAAAGDPAADKLVDDTAWFLAVATTNLIHTVDPAAVVFAGGLAAAGEPFLARIRRHVGTLALSGRAAPVRIAGGELGAAAGVVGAAAAARRLAGVVS